MSQRVSRSLLFGCLSLAAWANGGYLLALLVARRGRVASATGADSVRDLPHLTVVIGVYNEEASIVAKIDNVLALSYPSDRLDVVVASDGSDDATNVLVRGHQSPRVRLLAFAARRGRALVTNDVVSATESEWLLFTDADTRMPTDFLEHMAPHLCSAAVGVADASMVCVNEGQTTVARDVGLYWRFESALKRLESDAGLLASTFGACTLVRRAAFRPLRATEDVDFTTPLDALADGFTVVHEPRAIVFEFAHAGIAEQFRARRRMVAKNLPGTLRKLPAIRRRPTLIAAIVSHKILRWTTPVWLVAALVANGRLAGRSRFYRTLLTAQAAFYATGAAGLATSSRGRDLPVASTVGSFLVANAGFAAGVAQAVRGTAVTTWEPLRGASDG